MSDIESTREALRRSTLFDGVGGATIEAIARIATRRHVEEGDAVYELGDNALDVYLVQKGRVRFSLGVGNRSDSAGSVITPNMVFGWAALVDQPRRVATALCLEPCDLLVIRGTDLLSVLHNDPAAGFVVMRRLAVMIARNFIT